MSIILKISISPNISGVKLIHIASLGGFSEHDIFHKISTFSNSDDKKNFLTAFEKIILSSTTIPNKTAIVINEEDDVFESPKRKLTVPASPSTRKLKLAASSKGQKTLDQFFTVKKASPNEKVIANKNSENKEDPAKKVSKLDRIVEELRPNDEIKILRVPRKCFELNPSEYVSIFLLNEVSSYIENNTGCQLMEACEDALDKFPNEAWCKIIKFIDDFYKNEI
jgi:hypothetical protein